MQKDNEALTEVIDSILANIDEECDFGTVNIRMSHEVVNRIFELRHGIDNDFT